MFSIFHFPLFPMIESHPHSRKSLLHIEDDLLWGRAVKRMVNTWQEVCHVGTATSARAGIALCRTHQPDLALLDLELPDADGFDLALTLANFPRPPRILLFTVRADALTLFRAGCASIAGMVWKADPVNDTLRCAVREIMAGRRYFPEDVRQAMRATRTDPAAFFKILSSRELSMLPLLCRGHTDGQIAGQNGLCPATVKSHRQHIMSKLNLHCTADLIRWAEEKGFVEAARRGKSNRNPDGPDRCRDHRRSSTGVAATV
jgi:DNA-binding NarL/FixJ family response regulator